MDEEIKEPVAEEVKEPEATPKEIALQNLLNETMETLKQTKEELKKVQTTNHELLLKMPVKEVSDDDLFAPFSKYKAKGGI